MRPLGPIEAFEPALERTRSLLFRPFRLGRSWKLAASAYLALCGSLFVPIPFPLLFFPRAAGSALVWSVFALFTVLLFALYYLGSRMQLVLFDLVLSRERFIAPLWRQRPASLIWRWIGIKLAVTLPLAVLAFLPLRSALHRLISIIPHGLPGSSTSLAAPTPPSFDPNLLSAFLSLYAIFFGALGVLFFASSLLSDFILPSLALEDASPRVAFRLAFALVQSEPLTMLGFVAFQLLLTAVGLIAQYAAALIASLLAGIPLVLIALAGYALLHATLSPLLLTITGVLLYLTFIVLTMYLQLASFGVLMLFLRTYSLFFLAGRYSPLGDRLATDTLPPPRPEPNLFPALPPS